VPSINDVTALRGRWYKNFCDNSIKALALSSVMMGGGDVKNNQKLRDLIYEKPLNNFKGTILKKQDRFTNAGKQNEISARFRIL
jgi:hypothetical protein